MHAVGRSRYSTNMALILLHHSSSPPSVHIQIYVMSWSPVDVQGKTQ